MRNFFLIFLLFISTSAYSIDDPFALLQYSVGEEVIKPLIRSDSGITVNWTAKTAQTITPIASGSNVITPIISGLNVILKTAVQNTPSTGTTGTSTPVVTGAVLTDAFQAASVAQSGVFIQGVLGLLDFSGKSLVLMSSKMVGSLMIQRFFDMSMFSFLSWQQVIDLSAGQNSFASVANITPLSSNDVINRSNQFNYYLRYQCGSYQLGGRVGANGYCMPYTVFYQAQLVGCNVNFLNSKSKIPFSSNSYEREVKTLLGAYDEMPAFSMVGCPTNDCLPNRVRYNSCDYDLFFNRVENPASKCPQGLVFDPFDSNYYGGADIQVCKPDYRKDEVNPLYDLFANDNNNFPYLEVYPDGTISNHPYVSDYISIFGRYPYNVTPLLPNSFNMFYYTKAIDQNVSVIFAFKPLVSESSFLISRTIHGLKLLRQGNIEVPLIIRDILKFSNDFQLLDRSFSFVTQDGFDIGVQNSYLSPKTYGIMGKTIAEQFGIKTLDTITPTGQPQPISNISASGVVPCGLNKNVQVLKTRTNAEGKVENYFETQNSPPCVTDWGKAPNPNNANNPKQLCPKQGEEGYDPECKENDFFNKSLKTLSDGFKLDSDSFKIKDITSDKCSAIEMDFTNAPLLKAGVIRFNMHCEYFAQNPSIEQFLRVVSMISWFILALFRLLSA